MNPSDPDFPEIVVLCGSTRFMSEFEKAMREETLAGHIVISVGLFGHQEGMDMDGPTKANLDELHKRKIDLGKGILVINPPVNVCVSCGVPCVVCFGVERLYWSECCGAAIEKRNYIGSSTRGEIEYAQANGKKIRYRYSQGT